MTVTEFLREQDKISQRPNLFQNCNFLTSYETNSLGKSNKREREAEKLHNRERRDRERNNHLIFKKFTLILFTGK
jgi:hypothetical protein